MRNIAFLIAAVLAVTLVVPNIGKSNTLGDSAADYAVSVVGADYLWGATGNGAYDCSGLTSSAWKEAGVVIPRVSTDQYKKLRKVKRKNLQPGDVVFSAYGRKGEGKVDHVAIYIGDGKVATASKSQGQVVIRELDQNTAVVGFARPDY